MEQVITRLNENIEKLKDFNYTVNHAEEVLWNDLEMVRAEITKGEEETKTVVKEWKFRPELLSMENLQHDGKVALGEGLTWQQSFVLGFLLSIWH
jgi:hypothetical protein